CAPVTEMPTVSPQHVREWPPSEQSLCQDTSEIPSRMPTFLSSPSALSPVRGDRCVITSSVNVPMRRNRSDSSSSCKVGDFRLNPRIRDGYHPSSVRAHHDAPSSWVAAVMAESSSADT